MKILNAIGVASIIRNDFYRYTTEHFLALKLSLSGKFAAYLNSIPLKRKLFHLHFYLIVFGFLLSHTLLAQVSVMGLVYDSETNKPIPFATIAIANTQKGTISDIDGLFRIQVNSIPTKFEVKSMGYADTIVSILSQSVQISLRPKAKQLKEAVILPGENPAIPIIKAAIANRDSNNPEKTTSFSYESYSKMVFGPEAGYVLSQDSIVKDDGNAVQPFYFFITETVTERIYMPTDNNYEKVVANRFSGLSNPSFTLIASEFQPFSFYSDYVSIVGLTYLSPLAKRSYNDYIFTLEQTTPRENDTLYVISFQPKSGSNFKGLIGNMTVNSVNFGVQNIKVRQSNPVSKTELKIEQMSELVDGKQWFPTQFNTYILFKTDDDQSPNSLNFIEARGKTYLKNISITPEFQKSDFPNVILSIEDSASAKTEEYWEEKRSNPLTSQEKNTYTKIDSVGKKHNFDQKLKVLEALTTGLLPLGPVAAEMDKFVDYNGFEGVRLGLGLRTSDKISKVVSVGAYGAYGFQDDQWKYGGDLKLKLSTKNDIAVGVKYKNDVMLSGKAHFYKKNPFNLRTYVNLYIERMDYIEGYEGYFQFRALKDFQNEISYTHYNQKFTYDYTYAPKNDTVLTSNQVFQQRELSYAFRFGYKEKYMQAFNQNVSLGSNLPYLWMRIAHSNTEFGSTFNYTKIEAKIEREYRVKGLGKVGFLVQGGSVLGEVPASFLHYGNGTKINGLNLYIQGAFNNMTPTEFLSDEYVSAFMHVSFGALYTRAYSSPEISIVSAAGWGSLKDKDVHRGIEFNTMEKGYFESGLLIDNILTLNTSGIGAGVFYRYGEYAYPEFSDNIGARISFLYVFQ